MTLAANENARKYFAKIARNSVRQVGLIVKKLPVTLLKAADDVITENKEVPPRMRYAVDELLEPRYEGQSLIDTIDGWGRDGIDGDYLRQCIAGIPFVKRPNSYVFFRHTYEEGGYQLVPVAFLVWGDYEEDRLEARVSIEGVNDTSAVAEIEAVITAPGAVGVGDFVFMWCIADIVTKRRQGSARYKRIIATTNNAAMRRIFDRYGFEEASMVFKDTRGRRLSAAARRRILGDVEHYQSGPLAAMTDHVEGKAERLMRTCPARADGQNRAMWQLCR